mgnify:CR=1 FL=1
MGNVTRIIFVVLLIVWIISYIISKFNKKYKDRKGFINKLKSFSKDMVEFIINLAIFIIILTIFGLLISKIFYARDTEARLMIDIGEKIPYLTYIVLTFWPFFTSLLKWDSIANEKAKKFWKKELSKEFDFKYKLPSERKKQMQSQKNIKDKLKEKYLNKQNIYISVLGFALAMGYHFLGFFVPGILYLASVSIINFLE